MHIAQQGLELEPIKLITFCAILNTSSSIF